jgi:hypothetical protein
MVDDDFNITGIIDWEGAYTMPESMAFSSPAWLWDVSDFFDGVIELSRRENIFAELRISLARVESRSRPRWVITCAQGKQRRDLISLSVMRFMTGILMHSRRCSVLFALF